MESAIVSFYEILRNKKDNFHINSHFVVDNWNIVFSNFKYKSSFSSLDTVFSSYADLLNQKRNYFQNIPFEAIQVWYIEVLKDKEKHFKEGHNFNIFNLLKEKFGFCIQETMHSRLIKFLLDSRETHGQGNLFLIEFLKMFGVESPEIGNWKVTAEVGRIDVLIERNEPKSIIVIENKSNWANDQSNQLYRYWYQAIYKKTKQLNESFYQNNNDKYKIIYLVPNTYKLFEEHSISKPKDDPDKLYKDLPDRIPMEIEIVTFNNHIQEWLVNCISALPENNHRIREYIRQYQSLCNNL